MWLNNVRMVLPDRVIERGALQIEGGVIVALREGDAPNGAVDLRGLTLLPGLIDLHGDMLERDIEPRPRARFPIELAMHELDKRLAATGITTAYAAVGFAWQSSDLRTQSTATEIIHILNEMRHTLLTDCRIHARFEVNNHDTIPILTQLLDQRRVDLVSIMDHTPGQGQYGDMERYIQFLREWLGFSEAQIAPAYERIAEKVAATQAAPRDWEVVRAITEIARRHNIPIASHDDDTLDKVRDQAALGVTMSEFPVNVAAAEAARAHGMHVIMGAPNAYRGRSNTSNLSALEAIKLGLVDILASDYFPAAMLHAPYKLAREDVLPLHEGIQLVSQNPADAVGLQDRGRIEVGRRADLVLVEEGDVPRVRATLRGGDLIYCDSHAVQLFELLAIESDPSVR